MSRHGLRRATLLSTLLGLVAYLTMSSSLLSWLGIPYAETRGNFIFKLHPGTYLLFVALLLSLLQYGNPLTRLLAQLRAMPLLGLFLLSTLCCFAYSLLRYGPSGIAFYIDTLMMPVVVALIMNSLDPRQRAACYRLMLGLIVLNALIGLAEVALRQHLIPYTVAGNVAVIEDEGKFRATALLGHPLENAFVTSIFLLASLDQPMSAWQRGLLCAGFVLALLAFGGRTSFLLCSAVLLARGGFAAVRGLATGRYSYLQILGGSIGGVLALSILTAVAWATGLGSRIFQSLYYDNSASVRVRIFQVFDYLDTYDLLFGVPLARIQAICTRIGLTKNFETIENFWLLMLMQLGAICFIVFVAGLLCGLAFLWRRTTASGRWTIVVFILTASTTNSLASKTCTLTMLFACLCSLLPGEFAPAPGTEAVRTSRYPRLRTD